MKRFQLLVMLAAITAAVIWYGFYRSRHTSSASVAVLLPKETLAFVHLPDFKQARADLHRTDLYQIWQEPAVQDFLQKPRGKIPTNGAVGQTVKELELQRFCLISGEQIVLLSCEPLVQGERRRMNAERPRP